MNGTTSDPRMRSRPLGPSTATDGERRLPPPPDITDAAGTALFFDLDGTLLEIAERPESVTLADATRDDLAVLARTTGGAVAIVTGRDIVAVDAILDPLVLPVAGVHGLTRRERAGDDPRAPRHADLVASAERILAPLLGSEPELEVERKSGAIALHYRRRPDLGAVCLDAMEQLANSIPNTRIVRGKMVAEIVLGSADKGSAVAEFMREHPFRGRRPVFAGDDTTDEDAFAVVNAAGGVSIKIGPGATVAEHRCRDVTDFLRWLAAVSARFAGAPS